MIYPHFCIFHALEVVRFFLIYMDGEGFHLVCQVE